MRLYFPVGQAEIIEVSWNDKKRETTISIPGGCLDLNPFRIPVTTPFTISKEGNYLFTSTQEKLLALHHTVELVNYTLCLDIQFKEESLYPVFPTNTFYIDDVQMVLFAEFAGVYYSLPVVISWWHQGKPCFTTIGEVPPLLQEGEGVKVVRSYAYGLLIDPAMPKGVYEVRLDLLTAKNLCCAEVRLMDSKRPRYGESDNLFRPELKGGRILDEFLE